MTAKYYIHGKYRKFGRNTFQDITFDIKYNDEIMQDLFNDFKNYCKSYVSKIRPSMVEFELMSWSKYE